MILWSVHSSFHWCKNYKNRPRDARVIVENTCKWFLFYGTRCICIFTQLLPLTSAAWWGPQPLTMPLVTIHTFSASCGNFCTNNSKIVKRQNPQSGQAQFVSAEGMTLELQVQTTFMCFDPFNLSLHIRTVIAQWSSDADCSSVVSQNSNFINPQSTRE